MGKLVYGYWDCKSCGSTGIRGDNRECPNCGCPRGSDTKFYMGENIEYVPANKATNKRPDWLCPYCDALNSAASKECKGCGASREDSEKNYFDLHEKTTPKPKTQQVTQSVSVNNPIRANTTTASFVSTISKILIPVIIIGLLIFAGVQLFTPHTEKMTVSSFSWERSIQIEHYVTVDESGWTLPSKARLRYSNQEIKEYRNVLDHYETRTRQVEKERIVGYEEYVVGYEDLGNGMFEEITDQRPVYETYYETETYEEPIYRQEPVYATRYYYEIEKWKPNRKVNTSGADKNPEWGSVTLESNERVLAQNEKYIVYFYDKKNKNYSREISYSLWNELSQGDTINVRISRLGIISEITV